MRVREIITGRKASAVELPLNIGHDDLVRSALKALRIRHTDDLSCLRLFLPEANSLMRVDLCLADYFTPCPTPSVDVFLVPCPPGTRPDAPPSEESLAEAARAEIEADTLARTAH